MKKRILPIVLLSLFFIMATLGCITTDKNETSEDGDGVTSQMFKILHIMSYHSPWKWTDDQLNGFKEVLNDYDIEYKVFQMDTKNNSTDEWEE